MKIIAGRDGRLSAPVSPFTLPIVPHHSAFSLAGDLRAGRNACTACVAFAFVTLLTGRRIALPAYDDWRWHVMRGFFYSAGSILLVRLVRHSYYVVYKPASTISARSKKKKKKKLRAVPARRRVLRQFVGSAFRQRGGWAAAHCCARARASTFLCSLCWFASRGSSRPA